MSIAFIIFLLIIRLVKYQNREYMLFCLFAHSFNTTFFDLDFGQQSIVAYDWNFFF